MERDRLLADKVYKTSGIGMPFIYYMSRAGEYARGLRAIQSCKQNDNSFQSNRPIDTIRIVRLLIVLRP